MAEQQTTFFARCIRNVENEHTDQNFSREIAGSLQKRTGQPLSANVINGDFRFNVLGGDGFMDSLHVNDLVRVTIEKVSADEVESQPAADAAAKQPGVTLGRNNSVI